MGYIEIFEMDENGAGWKNLDDLSFSDKVELELAVTTSNQITACCFTCLKVITDLSNGYFCEEHKKNK